MDNSNTIANTDLPDYPVPARAKPERNYGIDLLRVLSMVYIVMLHTLGNGGILSAAGGVGAIPYRFPGFGRFGHTEL